MAYLKPWKENSFCSVFPICSKCCASVVSEEETYDWGVHHQAELDLLLFWNGKRLGFEVKYTDTPRVTSSQRVALET